MDSLPKRVGNQLPYIPIRLPQYPREQWGTFLVVGNKGFEPNRPFLENRVTAGQVTITSYSPWRGDQP